MYGLFYPRQTNVQDVWVSTYPQYLLGLNAVTSVNFSQSVAKSELNVLGRQTDSLITNGQFSYNVGITKNLVNKDVIWELTGQRACVVLGFEAERHTQITGYIEAHSGYLESYELQLNVGQVPQVSANFIFDNAKEFYTSSMTGIYTPPLTSNDYALAYLPESGISLGIGWGPESAIQSWAVQSATFSVKFNIQKEPLVIKNVNDSTNRGNYFISRLARPTLYTSSVSLLANSFEIDEFLFRNPKDWDLLLTREGGVTQSFSLPNAELVGESVNMTPDGIPVVQLEYRGVG